MHKALGELEVLENKKIDIRQMQDKITYFLHNRGVTPEMRLGSRGTSFVVKTKESEIVITLGEAWVGYEFSVNKVVLGMSVGITHDTDLYPLEGDTIDWAKEIFSEAFECLKALLEKRIYIGRSDGDPILAVPTPGSGYQLKRYIKKKRWWQFDSMTTSSLTAEEFKSRTGLRPVA